jgi:hypothetical protein
VCSLSTDAVDCSVTPMDIEEATSDSGIGLETMAVAGDSLNEEDERPFCSVLTVSTEFTDNYSILTTDFFPSTVLTILLLKMTTCTLYSVMYRQSLAISCSKLRVIR